MPDATRAALLLPVLKRDAISALLADLHVKLLYIRQRAQSRVAGTLAGTMKFFDIPDRVRPRGSFC
ncbi:hypothetical protein M378DRAFT_163646 [Amanita muscaria Koide BX008]|uniref:Uncharacterized protein n=1 Tax=Amanita muscaria (strain Koide BX008) TaxID=946122 RepID=A0A0C2SLU9_AMAMK|nr:hypothetical protein M378DRAFT_163646 [Amanita muscaria Koide BX008]